MADQLTCGACGFSNEPERVYCHNCGAKLDRSLLPTVEQEKGTETAQSARKRIMKMTNPGGYTIGGIVKSLLAVLFWAIVVACVFLISQKPDGVPEDKNALPTRLIQSELMDATQSPTPRTLAFSEADVNAALKQTVKRAGGDSGIPGVAFQRAYTIMTPNVIHLGTEQALWGYPIYAGVNYELAVVGGKFTPKMLGGNFGRLRVHPAAMQYLDIAFQKLWTALHREHEQVQKMQDVRIGQGQVILVTKGATAR